MHILSLSSKIFLLKYAQKNSITLKCLSSPLPSPPPGALFNRKRETPDLIFLSD